MDIPINFYKNLVIYYDDFFSSSAQEMSFLKKRLAGANDILDIGCGTGNKTVHLANIWQKVVALDADRNMIDQARLKHQAPNISYQLSNMLRLKENFEPQSFDALVCLGNTLVHLSKEEIGDFLSQARRLLKNNSLAVIQILNYDYLIAQQISELPILETREASFRRYYRWQAGDLVFATELELKNGPTFQNEISLCPIKKAELEEHLERAGFGRHEFFSSFTGAPWTPESLMTMVICQAA